MTAAPEPGRPGGTDDAEGIVEDPTPAGGYPAPSDPDGVVALVDEEVDGGDDEPLACSRFPSGHGAIVTGRDNCPIAVLR